jgi:Short C-terminal domain/Phospholipase_D-nuclease N-terminal
VSFWEVFWYIVIIFAFVAYLMVLFSILSDLFRDHETGGFAKAIWILALIFFPFATALIYLIARGKGMAERNVKAAKEMQDAQNAYIRDVAGSSPADQIHKAKELLDSGAISQAEFDAIKTKALG